jgi:hypothetical protein
MGEKRRRQPPILSKEVDMVLNLSVVLCRCEAIYVNVMQ